MSKIFELFGYPLESWNEEARRNCQQARCPFMGGECDGGGNRYSSGINLETRKDLREYFPGRTSVQAGICSLRTRPGAQPWIVCPRRLLSLKATSQHQSATFAKLVEVSEVPAKSTLRAWSEVTLKLATENEDEEAKQFHYSFDYVLTGLGRKPISDVARLIGKSEAVAQKLAVANGYTLAQRGNQTWVDDFPSEPIVIVEVMTSSTSGGDKKKRTQIAMAFEDAVKNGQAHRGPGINYRQVWARMVSQLIVKSQVGIAWGGKTIWLLQDVLADYISHSTALNLEKYVREHSDEVNMLAFGYGEKANRETSQETIIELTNAKFYSGPVSEAKAGGTGFIDIVKIGAPPPKDRLWKALFLKQPCASLRT